MLVNKVLNIYHLFENVKTNISILLFAYILSPTVNNLAKCHTYTYESKHILPYCTYMNVWGFISSIIGFLCIFWHFHIFDFDGICVFFSSFVKIWHDFRFCRTSGFCGYNVLVVFVEWVGWLVCSIYSSIHTWYLIIIICCLVVNGWLDGWLVLGVCHTCLVLTNISISEISCR